MLEGQYRGCLEVSQDVTEIKTSIAAAPLLLKALGEMASGTTSPV